jgi:hypothetical protein
MAWRTAEIGFRLFDDLTSESVVTVEIATPAGVLLAMAEPEERGKALILHGFHMQATRGANSVGPGNLRLLADIVMERMGYDEIVIEGAVRTSGANPGHRPRPRRFTRRPLAPSGARPQKR